MRLVLCRLIYFGWIQTQTWSFAFPKIDCPPFSIKLAWKYLAKIWKCFLHKVSLEVSLWKFYYSKYQHRSKYLSAYGQIFFKFLTLQYNFTAVLGRPMPRILHLEICSKNISMYCHKWINQTENSNWIWKEILMPRHELTLVTFTLAPSLDLRNML